MPLLRGLADELREFVAERVCQQWYRLVDEKMVPVEHTQDEIRSRLLAPGRELFPAHRRVAQPPVS